MNQDSESVTMVETPPVEVDPLDEKLVEDQDVEVSMVEVHFEQYVQRRLEAEAPYLLPGAVPPEDWSGTRAELDVIIARELEKFRVLCEHDFDVAILGRGWRTGELAGVEKPPAVSLTTGRVRRPPASTISAALEREAAMTFRQLRELDLLRRVEVPLLIHLEQANAGSFQGRPQALRAAVDAGKAVQAEHGRQQEERRAQAGEKRQIRVSQVCGPGRRYDVGVHWLTPEALLELDDWWVDWEKQQLGRAAKTYQQKPYEVVEVNTTTTPL